MLAPAIQADLAIPPESRGFDAYAQSTGQEEGHGSIEISGDRTLRESARAGNRSHCVDLAEQHPDEVHEMCPVVRQPIPVNREGELQRADTAQQLPAGQ